MASKRKKLWHETTPPMRRTGWREEDGGASYYGKDTRFSIHQHIDDPGKWFVSCYSLSATRIELKGATTLAEAKPLAPAALRARIMQHLEDIDESLKIMKE